MASDYASMRAENERRYGTDIGRIGPMLLADRYDDRTHFIYELLQNAEDALARRDGWSGPRAVAFEMSGTVLRVSHFGTPFTEADVRGICGIAESTKDLTSIGRFGIGFKSVCAFTDCPEIHSGDEHFAIDSFVWPRAIPAIGCDLAQTVFILPLRKDDVSAAAEIGAGLRKLGVRTLLFLREIEEISWSVDGGASGFYLRGKPEIVGNNARKVVVMGEEHGAKDVIEETWLIFSREVGTTAGVKAGHVEVAFLLGERDAGAPLTIQPSGSSTLVAFFPTIVPTNLGFLVQGPYRTTPSRDNVPRNDPWNQDLVLQTATLLVEGLRALRDMDFLTAQALRTLPLDRSKFGEGSMFAPLFDAVRTALSSESLLPQSDGGYVPAGAARLARTQELRELLAPAQLGALLEANHEIAWLSEEITQDRTADLRQYLMRELGIAEVVPETILPRLTKPFLEGQSDEWIVRLYEFLNGQPALLRSGRLDDVPLVRLENGSHVTPRKDHQSQAFLPGPVATAFPTVRRSVCAAEDARALLRGLGLTEPDPVDDVIRNVLPRYQVGASAVSSDDYAADIQRMLNAFGTDSKSRRESLVAALGTTTFLAAVDMGSGAKCFAQPTQVYLATERLKDLFEGVSGILLVDDSLDFLRGDAVREFLEACGATRYLAPVQIESGFTYQHRAEMRRNAGCEDCTYELGIVDFTLRGLQELLHTIPNLAPDRAVKRARLLWEALSDVEERRGRRTFSGSYRWQYYYPRTCDFDAAFVRHLNETAWVPDRGGVLQLPAYFLFQDLVWEDDPFLLSKIRFKPPVIEALAREAGIEPGVLDLLKKLGVTSEAELKTRLRIDDKTPETEEQEASADLTPEEAVRKLLGDHAEPTAPVTDVAEEVLAGSGGRGGKESGSRAGAGSASGGGPEGTARAPGGDGHRRSPGSAGGRPFISYVGAYPHDEEPDPDGLDRQARMVLEEKAIERIIAGEPHLQRTPTHNPGFDLFEAGERGELARRIEVKAMTGSLSNRAVGLSRAQFDCAREHGPDYWLYVVEHAADAANARIVRIQDPAGKARTFTFDHGWLDVADVDADQAEREG